MVKANDSWIFQQDSSQHSPNLSCTITPLASGQQNRLPSCMNPCIFFSSLAFPGFPFSALPGSRTVLANGAHVLSPCLPPLVKGSFSIPNLFYKECQSSFPCQLSIKTTPNDVTGPTQKRFLIFDQSGNRTRMFFSPLASSSQNHFVSTAKPPACHLCDEKQPPIFEQVSASKWITRETSNENPIIGDESDMREDTEEINALLYDDDDLDGEDDEVASTGHSPFAIKGSNENYEQFGEPEEAASLDRSAKRKKLLDGGYQKSSAAAATSLMLDRSSKWENDGESRCASAGARLQVKDMGGSILDYKQLRKDKILKTLRILESIIPGLMSKDPLLIIDEAINHLNFLKLKAKAPGIRSCP